jgi:hypothetical protein
MFPALHIEGRDKAFGLGSLKKLPDIEGRGPFSPQPGQGLIAENLPGPPGKDGLKPGGEPVIIKQVKNLCP